MNERGDGGTKTAARQGAEILPLLSRVPAQSSALLSIRPGAADAPRSVGGIASTAATLPAGHAG